MAAITLDAPPYLRRARPDVPEALARIVHSALLKDREQRIASADALAEALKPFALADDALTIDEHTFRQGPNVELPRPLPRHLALEVRREIARHVESQASTRPSPQCGSALGAPAAPASFALPASEGAPGSPAIPENEPPPASVPPTPLIPPVPPKPPVGSVTSQGAEPKHCAGSSSAETHCP